MGQRKAEAQTIDRTTGGAVESLDGARDGWETHQGGRAARHSWRRIWEREDSAVGSCPGWRGQAYACTQLHTCTHTQHTHLHVLVHACVAQSQTQTTHVQTTYRSMLKSTQIVLVLNAHMCVHVHMCMHSPAHYTCRFTCTHTLLVHTPHTYTCIT